MVTYKKARLTKIIKFKHNAKTIKIFDTCVCPTTPQRKRINWIPFSTRSKRVDQNTCFAEISLWKSINKNATAANILLQGMK